MGLVYTLLRLHVKTSCSRFGYGFGVRIFKNILKCKNQIVLLKDFFFYVDCYSRSVSTNQQTLFLTRN